MSSESHDESVAIRERMQRLRTRMDDRATQLSASTQEMFDWRTYARRYPIGILASGLLLGLLMAPGRKTAARKRSEQFSVNPAPAPPRPVAPAPLRDDVAGGKKPGLVDSTIVPWVRQFAWSYMKGLAAVHFDKFVQDLQATRKSASTATRTTAKDKPHAASLPETERRAL